MSSKQPINERHPLCGTWHDPAQDTDDYARSEYSVTVVAGQFQISAIDCSDGERFVITDIGWDGEWLTFRTFVPSTQRRGLCKMRHLDTHEIELLFTFTVREIWRRKLTA